MADFYPLTVTKLEHDTRDAVIVTLEPRPEDAARFAFVPGQYLTFRRLFDGDELRRSYSICAGPEEKVLKIGVKRVDGGAFSSFANAGLHEGDVIEAMPPEGRFRAPDETAGKTYLGFAAGSGVTPVLSIVRSILSGDPTAQFTLVYGNRSVSSIMFRNTLAGLKDRYLDRLNLVHVLSGEAQEIELFSGRIDANKITALTQHGWIEPAETDMAFICGPEPMMKAVSDGLKAEGMPADRIKFELFGADQPGRAKRRAEAEAARAAGDMVKATIIMDGVPHVIDMPRRGQSVLEAARAHDLDAPYSCQAGVCSTCMARLVKGEVEMAQNYALEDYEVQRGTILTCQSHPVSDEIVVEYDSH